MGDVRNIQDLRLTYGMYVTNSRHTERPSFTIDIQDTSALWKMVRTPRTDRNTFIVKLPNTSTRGLEHV